mgnify:CR=1 FL=1
MDRGRQLLLNTLTWPLAGAMRWLARPGAMAARLWRLAWVRSRLRGPVPPSTQFDGRVHISGTGRVLFGDTCRLGRDVEIETWEEGRIVLGDRVRINSRSLLVSYTEIRVGDGCLIGEQVSIRDADHGVEPNIPVRLQAHRSEPITIGSEVWIARGVVVLKGVTIGAGAVIGANAVVTRDVPAGAIALGVPARVVRQR